jgi:hypothetical protein
VRPNWPGGGVEECQPPVEGEPAFGEFEGVTACQPVDPVVAGAVAGEVVWAPGIELALPAGGEPAGCAPPKPFAGAVVVGAGAVPPGAVPVGCQPELTGGDAPGGE